MGGQTLFFSKMKKFIFKVTAYFMAFIAAGSIPLAFSSKDITAPDAVIKFLFFGSLFTGCIILVQILEKNMED